MNPNQQQAASTPHSAQRGPCMYYVMLKDSRSMVHPTQLERMIESQEVDANTMVWSDGMDSWKPVREIPKLAQLLNDRIASEPNKPEGNAASTSRWYYLDNGQKQKGPFEAKVISSLVSTGALLGTDHVWNESMDQWKPLSEVKEFASQLKAASKHAGSATAPAWFYMDKHGNQQGPVDAAAVSRLLSSNDATEHTLVWKPGMEAWAPVSSVSDITTASTSSRRGADAKAPTADGAQSTATKKRKKRKKTKKRKQLENTRYIYIQGLPKDISIEEIKDHFKKAGIIDENIDGTPKIKIYKDEKGVPKGDGLVGYQMADSVPLAIQILDESDIRLNCKIRVQKAEFKQKGDKYVARKRSKNEVALMKFKRKMALGWDDAGVRDIKGFRIVIMKHMFDPKTISAGDAGRFFDELEAEVGKEVEEKCGPVAKLTIFRNNPEGVIAVRFKSGQSAATCIKLMNGRFFGRKQIKCFYFDGKTNYKVGESEESERQREQEYLKWMMGDGQDGQTNAAKSEPGS